MGLTLGVRAQTPGLGLQLHPYQMSDLEVLAAEKNAREFLNHALDIRPSERDKKWRELVSQMALLTVAEASRESPLELKSFDFIQNIANWPSLAQDDYFQLKRADYATTFFKQCFARRSAQNCLERMQAYQNSSRPNPNLALLLIGELKKYLPTYSRTQLLMSITKGEFSQEFCARSEVQAELLALLLAKAYTATPKPQLYADQACLTQLDKPLKEMLYSFEMNNARASYEILRALDKLDASELDQFYTYYLLSSPATSELFNLAWNNLRALGSDYERRQLVLKKLKQLEPVPGRSFGDPDIRKRRTLTEAFLTHFPEYTDYYLKHCFTYLEGKGDYPRGNPTPYCDDLVMVGKMKRALSDEVYLRHSALKKFKTQKK